MTIPTPLNIDEIADLLDIDGLSENTYLEIKKAAGRDGRGQLPESFFSTYSAFANTQGGIVLLGFEQVNEGDFNLIGIKDPDRVIDQLWSNLNNREKVNINILTNAVVSVVTHDRLQFIKIVVPEANRHQKPVFIGINPFTGTYRRNFSGDYLCDEHVVRRMIAEQVEDTRDAKLLSHFTERDLDNDTLRSYRILFRSAKPTHPWNSLEDREFLRSIGGLTRDRVTGEEGLTLAGLLMFGRLRPILDVLPHYLLDYQERKSEGDDGIRWVDRITTDGAWSGNLYDFFQMVIQKLYRDLKIPFRLAGATRVDDTPVHEALREALTNTLVHADYNGTVPILIVKRPDMFSFRNPGTMRIPIEDAIHGGLSDCRNRNLQTMFDLIGYGERAGSGLPIIFRNWREQLWRRPELRERYNPEQTSLILRMMSLLPDAVMQSLERRFGTEFNELSEEQKLALATVEIEGVVTHARIKEMSDIHPHDLTKALRDLVTRGFLQSAGATRAMVYSFNEPVTPVSDGTIQTKLGLPEQTGDSSVHLGNSSVHLGDSSVHLNGSSERLDRLRKIIEAIDGKRKVPATVMEDTILNLCQEDYMSLRDIAGILRRTSDTLRIHYLNGMVKSGKLELRYPDKPSHPDQGYRTRRE